MKCLNWLSVGWLLAIALFSTSLSAHECTPEQHGTRGGTRVLDDLVRSCMANSQRDCEKWVAEGGGGEGPRLKGNTKVELAMGERYILVGTVTIEAGDPLLNISFAKQPWLANRVRVKNPFYRIDDSAVNWRAYVDREITVIATARYTTWTDKGRKVLEIYLDATPESVVDALQER